MVGDQGDLFLVRTEFDGQLGLLRHQGGQWGDAAAWEVPERCDAAGVTPCQWWLSQQAKDSYFQTDARPGIGWYRHLPNASDPGAFMIVWPNELDGTRRLRLLRFTAPAEAKRIASLYGNSKMNPDGATGIDLFSHPNADGVHGVMVRDGEAWFLPFADGVFPYALNDANDFAWIEDALCEAFRDFDSRSGRPLRPCGALGGSGFGAPLTFEKFTCNADN